MQNSDHVRSKGIIIFRGVILILSLAFAFLIIIFPPWFRPYFERFLLWLPYPKVAVPLFVLFGYPMLLAMLELGLGHVPFSPLGVLQSFLMQTVDLYSDLLLTFLILIPVGIEAFFWLVVAFFGGLNIACLIWGYRWLTGEAQLVINTDTIVIFVIYVVILIFLTVIGIYKERLKSKQEAYVDFAHNLREKALKKAVLLRNRL